MKKSIKRTIKKTLTRSFYILSCFCHFLLFHFPTSSLQVMSGFYIIANRPLKKQTIPHQSECVTLNWYTHPSMFFYEKSCIVYKGQFSCGFWRQVFDVLSCYLLSLSSRQGTMEHSNCYSGPVHELISK